MARQAWSSSGLLGETSPARERPDAQRRIRSGTGWNQRTGLQAGPLSQSQARATGPGATRGLEQRHSAWLSEPEHIAASPIHFDSDQESAREMFAPPVSLWPWRLLRFGETALWTLSGSARLSLTPK